MAGTHTRWLLTAALLCGGSSALATGCDRVRALRLEPHRVVLDSAAGLRVGDPVRVAGVELGRVMELEHRHAEAVIAVRLDGEVPLYADACALVAPKSSFGPRHLLVRVGAPGGVPLEPGVSLPACGPALDLPQILDQMTPLLEEGEGPSYEDTVRSLRLANALLRLVFGDGDKTPDITGRLGEVEEGVRGFAEAVEGSEEGVREFLSDGKVLIVELMTRQIIAMIDDQLARLEREVPADLERLEARLQKIEDALDEATTEEAIAERRARLVEIADLLRSLRAELKTVKRLPADAIEELDSFARQLRLLRDVDERTLREFMQVEGTRSNFDSVPKAVREALEREGIPLEDPDW